MVRMSGVFEDEGQHDASFPVKMTTTRQGTMQSSNDDRNDEAKARRVFQLWSSFSQGRCKA